MSSPHLTVAIPAYNRVELLRRALDSIARTRRIQDIEVVVSDDSTDENVKKLVKAFQSNWSGKLVYEHNCPSLGMAANWNQAISLARGRYLLLLHDDDYFLPGGIDTVLDAIECYQDRQVFLFGVEVVNEFGKTIKRQIPDASTYLQPPEALRRVVSDSSYVRFPAIVYTKQAIETCGLFDLQLGFPADVDMWIRLFASYGLMRINRPIAAYYVHSQALTMQMFNRQNLEILFKILDRAEQTGLLAPEVMDRCRAAFVYQFVLGGTWRHLKARRFLEARSVLQLLALPEMSALNPPLQWRLTRRVFELVTRAAGISSAPAGSL